MTGGNKTLVERVFQFQEAIKHKNSPLAGNIARALIPLLEYNGFLETISREELARISRIGANNVVYLVRLFQGEDISSVAKDVPLIPVISSRRSTNNYQSKETGNWDGSSDNATRTYEGG